MERNSSCEKPVKDGEEEDEKHKSLMKLRGKSTKSQRGIKERKNQARYIEVKVGHYLLFMFSPPNVS